MGMRLLTTLACLLAGWLAGQPAALAKPLKIVTTLSTFASLVESVGGERVSVEAVVPPAFNPHFIEPRPSDVLKVKRADLFIHAGLDLELWRMPLLEAAGNTALFPGQPGELDLSQGILLLEVPSGSVSRAQGDIHLYGNPHYWLDPENGKIMARTVAEKLSELDPANAEAYRRRLDAFLGELDGKIREWRVKLSALSGQELVAYHNQWPYLMRFVGLKLKQFLEPKPGIPPTPKQIEFLEQYMRQRRIRAVAQATFYPKTAAESLGQRTGAKVLLLCQNVKEVPEASDYIRFVDYNIGKLAEGLKP